MRISQLKAVREKKLLASTTAMASSKTPLIKAMALVPLTRKRRPQKMAVTITMSTRSLS